ncbi:motility protein A [Alkalibacter mobilis]|uniref:motility protein A n=1 Tax=Alkalibacter mobilis TaxID=2787712 RepID=UPI00189E3D92|nr:MotA/TolQ/ExbB proton channel family protein [Alkalibacter mobilis]MBF7096314.1 MotA/TolQ/ExbB proton channel family protein [Alkalibacter mobilis]
MKKNFTAIIGLVAGFALIVISILMSGDIQSFVSLSSIVVTLGGSFCALLISFPLKDLMKLPKILKMLVIEPENDRKRLILIFSELARKARRDGLLALEDDIATMDDEFMISGLQMVVDGIDPDIIREILTLKMETTERRHRMGQNIFTKWGELSPAFGMLGTLIGLIVMLANLQDASSIGTGMAVALITTFYGSLTANLVFIPVASNLSVQTNEEMFSKEMAIEGIIEIQAGTNPRILEEKLMTYLSPEDHLVLKEEKITPGVEAEAYE